MATASVGLVEAALGRLKRRKGSDEAAEQASGSSFYAAMRILPRPQRAAMYQIYAFCRAVDDVVDGSDVPPAERRAHLQRWREDIDALYAGAPPARLAGLAGPLAAYRFERADFLAVIDGVETDAGDDVRLADWSALELYCDRVACAVGRLCVRIFGIPGKEGTALADHLGKALQLTNILRDMDEDAAIGRLYLPRQTLAEAGIEATEPADVMADARLGRACAVVAAEAARHFDAARAIMARLPRRRVRAPAIMCDAYRAILDALLARGWKAPRRRVRLTRRRIAWILLRRAIA
jgi:phytoene synthase